MKREYYFAYGSNMNKEQMACRCPDAIMVSKGMLPFYRFAIDSAGVATVIESSFDFVEGVIWLISENDIRNLDRYEGVAQNCYRKEYLTTVKKDKEGTFIEALVYISCRPEWNRPTGTASSYMSGILESAYRLDFRPDYMKTLMKYAETNVIRIKRKARPSSHS